MGNPHDIEKMPALFIGHGSPMNLVLKNGFTDSLEKLGRTLPRPKAIMVVSAHWLTGGSTCVGCMERPRTIYDFYGFPKELYEMDYPCPGSPEFARSAIGLLKKAGVRCNNEWGLDHASWYILKRLYPKADIPVFEMSLDYSFNEWHPKTLRYHYELASRLSNLREKGVLIIGSGNIVHNLGIIDFETADAKPYDWAVEFDERVKSRLLNGDHDALIDYQNIKGASLSVPTLDHYLPMIYVLALQEKGEKLRFTHEGLQNASVSMRCFQIG